MGVSVLKLDCESENLFVLVRLDDEPTEEREKYFWKSVQDRGIDVDRTKVDHAYHRLERR